MTGAALDQAIPGRMPTVERLEARAVLALVHAANGREWEAASVLSALEPADLERVRVAATTLASLAAPLTERGRLARTREAAMPHEHTWARDELGSYCLTCPEETPERADLHREEPPARTRVVPDVGSPGRWVAQYRDQEKQLWFDIGDPRATEAEARAHLAAYLSEEIR